MPPAQSADFSAWMSGWFNQKTGYVFVDLIAYTRNVANIKSWCAISPGVVFGLSAISNPIGQEGLHQVDHQGSARVLFYLGFDLAVALANSPNTELVFRVQHCSGGYGTLGGMKEGNNANVVEYVNASGRNPQTKIYFAPLEVELRHAAVATIRDVRTALLPQAAGPAALRT
jgi:hypothetical protein